MRGSKKEGVLRQQPSGLRDYFGCLGMRILGFFGF